MRKISKTRRSAFTLMEVLLVLAILVILGSLVTVSVRQIQRNSNIRAAKAQISSFGQMIQAYRIDVGSYPSTTQGLGALREQPADLKDPAKWKGPYTDKDIPKDPWSNEYQYELRDGDQFYITSYGPDGSEGGDDDVTSDST